MSEIKPCPFCGADNGYVDVIPNPFSNDIYSRGHCVKCHAVGTFYRQSYLEGELRPSFEQMAQMATEKWNTRPIEDALNKRIAELEAERRWIPVSERLPDNWESVLTIDISKSTRGPVTAFYNPEISLWSTHFSCDLWVTHWMPLPEPPIVYRKEREE